MHRALTIVRLWTIVAIAAFASGCAQPDAPDDLANATWTDIETAARGQTVTIAMWQGDPFINRYMTDWVAPRVLDSLGVTLEFVALQGNQIVSTLMTEREAKAATSSYDLLWINGETFYQLRQIEALYGPFVDRLPNAQFLNLESPFIAFDFQQPIDGFEAPWGNVQLALIYDSTRVPDPPRTPEALAAWTEANPGRFTIDSEFTGLTFLKSLLIHFAGGPGSLDGPFDEAKYTDATAKLWTYLKSIQPNLWQQGRTFPQGVAQLHQLFSDGEVDFSMSNNDGEVDNKVAQGLFLESAKATVLTTGTIQNSHYWGISERAANKAGALATINFLLSPEAQFEKAKPTVWGDGTVLDVPRLPDPWRDRFENIPGRTHAPPRADIQPFALQEPAAEYMIRLAADFRTQILGAE